MRITSRSPSPIRSPTGLGRAARCDQSSMRTPIALPDLLEWKVEQSNGRHECQVIPSSLNRSKYECVDHKSRAASLVPGDLASAPRGRLPTYSGTLKSNRLVKTASGLLLSPMSAWNGYVSPGSICPGLVNFSEKTPELVIGPVLLTNTAGP